MLRLMYIYIYFFLLQLSENYCVPRQTKYVKNTDYTNSIYFKILKGFLLCNALKQLGTRSHPISPMDKILISASVKLFINDLHFVCKCMQVNVHVVEPYFM